MEMVACEWGDLQPQSFEGDNVKTNNIPIVPILRRNTMRESTTSCLMTHGRYALTNSMEHVLVVYKT
jgi:hypothetical protein